MSKDLDLGAVSLTEWTEDSTQVGTPTMVLLPANNYHFKVSGKYKITIPRRGNYHEIDPSFFDKADGSFDLLNGKELALYLPAISKVLFATKQYPALGKNELFAPIALVFNADSVDIYGQLVRMLPAEEVSKNA